MDTTLEPSQTALIVVDLQEKLVPAIARHERLLRNAVLLLRAAQTLEMPVLLTTQYQKGLGPVVPQVLAEAPGAEPFDKTTFGCFGSEEFTARVRAMEERTQLLVIGVESHICVAQTVLEAIRSDYDVHVASDAIGARTEENHRIGLARMDRAGAVVSSTEMAIYELLGRSDTAAFKTMLPHLKG
jgi:nicotinamidase-related amidase